MNFLLNPSMALQIMFLLLIYGYSKGILSLTVPVTITKSTDFSRHSWTYQHHHSRLTIHKQTTNSEDLSEDEKSKNIYNNNDIDPDDIVPSPTKFKQKRQSRRSYDFPPLTYADSLLDMPFEPEVSAILKAARATRLVKGRSYARRDAFEKENIASRPTLDDLSPPTPPPGSPFNKIWISATYRFGIIFAAYFSFPPITRTLEQAVTVTPDLVNELTSKFAPGISILYGTFISLTLSILYDRLKNIQNSVAAETSLISLLAQNVLVVFRNDEERMVRGGQCIADQIRILVKESRGRELMSVIYSDPYLRILELVAEKEDELIMQKDTDVMAARSVSFRVICLWRCTTINRFCPSLFVSGHLIYLMSYSLLILLYSCYSSTFALLYPL